MSRVETVLGLPLDVFWNEIYPKLDPLDALKILTSTNSIYRKNKDKIFNEILPKIPRKDVASLSASLERNNMYLNNDFFNDVKKMVWFKIYQTAKEYGHAWIDDVRKNGYRSPDGKLTGKSSNLVVSRVNSI